MSGLSNTTRLANHDGKASGFQGSRMAQGAGTGRSISRNLKGIGSCDEWPGREYGIRKPYPSETALSWQEVKHFLNMGAYA